MVPLSDLEPGVAYLLQIIAKNDAGVTEAEYDFVTLSPAHGMYLKGNMDYFVSCYVKRTHLNVWGYPYTYAGIIPTNRSSRISPFIGYTRIRRNEMTGFLAVLEQQQVCF